MFSRFDKMKKTAFITGAAQGIGKGYARTLLQNGYKVFITDVNEEKGATTYAEFATEYGGENVCFTQCDVRNMDSLKAAYSKATERFEYVSVMINNAGILNESELELCVDVNLNGVIRGIALAFEHMRKDRGGHGGIIINTSSIAARPSSKFHFIPIYTATKCGIEGYCKSTAADTETVKSGIRVVCLCPSAVQTALFDIREEQVIDFEWFKKERSTAEYLSTEEVGAGLMKAIGDEDNNGSYLVLMKNQGVVEMKYAQ